MDRFHCRPVIWQQMIISTQDQSRKITFGHLGEDAGVQTFGLQCYNPPDNH